jgi:hypothetical protein
MNDPNETTESDQPEPPLRLSAKATRKDGSKLTESEIEAAEEEAEAWARRVNSC